MNKSTQTTQELEQKLQERIKPNADSVTDVLERARSFPITMPPSSSNQVGVWGTGFQQVLEESDQTT